MVEITAADNILDEITLRVIDGELIIDNRDCINNTDINIFITMPDIRSVHTIGSGDIYGDNIWETDELELRVTGSGEIDVEFIADDVWSEITGSGRLTLYGDVNLSTIYVSGSGDVKAFGLEADQQEVDIKGSGNCEVVARDLLEVQISGSGNVFYKGNPHISATISGSGSIIDAN